jgi:hypothetical protein
LFRMQSDPPRDRGKLGTWFTPVEVFKSYKTPFLDSD